MDPLNEKTILTIFKIENSYNKILRSPLKLTTQAWLSVSITIKQVYLYMLKFDLESPGMSQNVAPLFIGSLA